MSRPDKLAKRVKDLESALQRAQAASDALRRVGMAVGTSDVEELLQLIVETTTGVLSAERATLYLRDGDRLISRVKVGDELKTIEVALGQGIAGHVAKTGRALRIADAYKDNRFDRAWDEKSGYLTRSILAVPIKSPAGELLGVIQVLNKIQETGKRSLFTRYDTQLLIALATQAAISIDKASFIDRLRAKNILLAAATERSQRTARDLELLYELETAMSRADSLAELARRVVAKVGAACDAEAGALLHQANDGRLTLYIVNLSTPDTVREVIVQPGAGIAARAMQQNELLRIDDARRVRDPQRVRRLLGVKLHSAIAAPMGGRDQPVSGALALYNHHKSNFRDQDEYLLQLVSANVSTELRLLQARQLRERADRLQSIGGLLSGVMHDLRTPLTVISGYVQLMEMADEADKRAEYGRIVSDQFDLVHRMSSDLLAYARGETTLLVRKVYLVKLFDQLRTSLLQRCEAAGIELVVEVRESGVAFLDEGKLTRVLHNLANNAVEAMEQDGGKLTIICQSDDEDLEISIEDTGSGIPKGIRKKLFEPFVTSGKKLGTGLGLANVKKIVEEHSGSVRVRSSRKGTCFTVRIPMAMRSHSLRSQALS